MTTFAQAFREARQRLGAGKTFTWNGKQYSTNTAEDNKGGSSRRAPASSPRPPERSTSSIVGMASRAIRRAEGQAPTSSPRPRGRPGNTSRPVSSNAMAGYRSGDVTTTKMLPASASRRPPARPSRTQPAAATARTATSTSQRDRVAQERARARASR